MVVEQAVEILAMQCLAVPEKLRNSRLRVCTTLMVKDEWLSCRAVSTILFHGESGRKPVSWVQFVLACPL